MFISADIAVMAVSRFKSIAVDVMNSAILRWLYIGEDENSNGSRPYNRLLRAMDRSRALYS